jgi:hypothetical protein
MTAILDDLLTYARKAWFVGYLTQQGDYEHLFRSRTGVRVSSSHPGALTVSYPENGVVRNFRVQRTRTGRMLARDILYDSVDDIVRATTPDPSKCAVNITC